MWFSAVLNKQDYFPSVSVRRLRGRPQRVRHRLCGSKLQQQPLWGWGGGLGGAASPARGFQPLLCALSSGSGPYALFKSCGRPHSTSHREGFYGFWDAGWGSPRPWAHRPRARGDCPGAVVSQKAGHRALLCGQSKWCRQAASAGEAGLIPRPGFFQSQSQSPSLPHTLPAWSARHTQHTRDAGLCYTGPHRHVNVAVHGQEPTHRGLVVV